MNDQLAHVPYIFQELSKENKGPTLAGVAIPSNWNTCVDFSGAEYCELMNDSNGMPQECRRMQV